MTIFLTQFERLPHGTLIVMCLVAICSTGVCEYRAARALKTGKLRLRVMGTGFNPEDETFPHWPEVYRSDSKPVYYFFLSLLIFSAVASAFLAVCLLLALLRAPAPISPREKLDAWLSMDIQNGISRHAFAFAVEKHPASLEACHEGIRASGVKIEAGKIKGDGVVSAEGSTESLRKLAALDCVTYIEKAQLYQLQN